jgi:hypothetical protein
VLCLDDLYPNAEKSLASLGASAELIAHHRILDRGTLVHLTGDEFLSLWHERPHPFWRGAPFGRGEKP